MLLTAVETADCPEATPSAYRGVDAIGSPVDLLNRRSVLVGGIDGVKMTLRQSLHSRWDLGQARGTQHASGGVAVQNGQFQPVTADKVAGVL